MSLGRCLSTRAQGLRPAQRPRPALLLRGIATGASGAPPTGQTVALAFDHFPVPAARSRPPLHSSAAHGKPETASAQAVQRAGVQNVVVAHGLFGSKQNWRSLGRRMAQRWGVPVYTIDLRNHGESPHLDGMHYADMASDVVRFLGERQLQGSLLIGHSMGGKTALATALSPELSPGVLSGLVSVDMSPARGALSAEFAAYLKAMLAIEEAHLTSRTDADDMLAQTEPSLAVRQFLLTNLERKPAHSDFWTFRIPLQLLQRHIAQLGDFPYAPGETEPYQGKTLFIKGAKSKYINRHNIPIANALYPNQTHIALDTGHWVQAEKPHAFIDVVEKFLANNPESS